MFLCLYFDRRLLPVFGAISQPLGIEKANFVLRDTETDFLAPHRFAVYIDYVLLGIDDLDLVGAQVADQVGTFFILSLFELANDLRHLNEIDFFDDENIQQSIVRLRLWHRVEAAAVVASVAHAHQSLFPGNDLAVDSDLAGSGDAFAQVDGSGQIISAGAFISAR